MKINPTAHESRLLIGSRLRQLRDEKGLTQPELSELTGLSVWTISKIENGKWNCTVEKLSAMLSALEHEIYFKPINKL